VAVEQYAQEIIRQAQTKAGTTHPNQDPSFQWQLFSLSHDSLELSEGLTTGTTCRTSMHNALQLSSTLKVVLSLRHLHLATRPSAVRLILDVLCNCLPLYALCGSSLCKLQLRKYTNQRLVWIWPNTAGVITPMCP